MIKVPLLAALLAALPLITSAQGSEQKTRNMKWTEPPVKDWYLTSSGEWIFSMPILDVGGSSKGAVVRFSPFFNVQGLANYDLNKHFGIFTGLTVRNLGFIYDVPDSPVRYKFRTYNVGIPVGIKVGTMNKALVFVGYELELPFNYKEKRFENEKKEDKFDVWLSNRNELLFHSLMLGVQGPHGTTIKFKYYLNNFHNTDFTETVDGVETKPYQGLNANIFYVSLAFDLFDGGRFIYSPDKKTEEKQAWLAPTI
jgi:hypothetical protein